MVFDSRSRPLRALLLVLLLSGCASNLPREITRAPEDAPALVDVQGAPERFTDVEVRWGGVIVSVDNQPDESRIEIVEKPLYRSGRPLDSDQSNGRFIAVVRGFLDPAVFDADRLLTVFGELDSAVRGKIGEFEYYYPVVRVSRYHLWQPIKREIRPGYWNDPLYDPWYGPWRRPGYRLMYDPYWPHYH